MDRTRKVPFSVALRKGWELANWHRARHDRPDPEAWAADLRTFKRRTDGQYSPRDLELIQHHAEALLGYDRRSAVEQPGLFAPESIRRFGNVMSEPTGGEHGRGWKRRKTGGQVPAH